MNEEGLNRILDHPFITKMIDFFTTTHFYVLVMEYCPGGELFELLKQQRHMG